MDALEVRLSPDGQRVAVRFPGAEHWTLHGLREHCGSGSSDGYVSDWTPLRPVSNEDEPVDIYLPGGRYYGRWITASDHDVTLGCSCGYTSGVEELPPVLDRAADELHRGH